MMTTALIGSSCLDYFTHSKMNPIGFLISQRHFKKVPLQDQKVYVSLLLNVVPVIFNAYTFPPFMLHHVWSTFLLLDVFFTPLGLQWFVVVVLSGSNVDRCLLSESAHQGFRNNKIISWMPQNDKTEQIKNMKCSNS